VRVVRGAILDVAVDIRRGSPTYGRHVAATISAADWGQIFIPPGFAHGFCTLQPDTEVLYKVDNYYAPTHDRGLLWNDAALGIEWPVTSETAILADKDRLHPALADLPGFFWYSEFAADRAA
jgi:dTDP-4-dehydrorhamnose 3,5-epimerase